MIRMRTAAAVAGAAGLALASLVALAPPARADLPGPFVTIEFSRTEQTVAVNCVPVPGQPTLANDVQPYLSGLGLTFFGTVNTLATSATPGCINGTKITSDWAQLQQLAAAGELFGPHEYDGPDKVANLTPEQQWQVTCGQAQTLQANGLGPGTGMIAYPGAQGMSPAIVALQQNYGQNCFDWGRSYGGGGVTDQSAASTAPYWQHTTALKGGPGQGSRHYTTPDEMIAQIQALQPGQWLTIQVYLLVTGVSPPGSPDTWTCDQPGVPNASSFVERYCLNDFKKVMSFLAGDSQVTVASPAAVAAAWGRSAPGMAKP